MIDRVDVRIIIIILSLAVWRQWAYLLYSPTCSINKLLVAFIIVQQSYLIYVPTEKT